MTVVYFVVKVVCKGTRRQAFDTRSKICSTLTEQFEGTPLI